MSKYSETVAKLADLARQINEDSERFWHPEKRPGVMMQIFPNSQLIPGCTQVRVYMMGYKDYEDFSCSFELRADKPFATETVGEKVKEVHIPDAVKRLEELLEEVKKKHGDCEEYSDCAAGDSSVHESCVDDAADCGVAAE